MQANVHTTERRHIGTNGQGSLAMLSRYLLLKVMEVNFLKIP
jgi:hypothetical protein